MDIRQMNYIVALGKHLNFTRASEELHIAQTSLSQQISAIEKELGVTLFERNNRSVKLTLAGEYFLREAKQLVTQYNDAVYRTKQAADQMSGNLTIGWWGEVEFMCLSKSAKKFYSQYPNSILSFYNDSLNMLIHALKTRRINALFVPSIFFPEKDFWDCRTILSTRLCAAVGHNHPFAKEKRNTVSPDELNNEKIIIINYNNTYGAYEKMLSQLNQMGLTPNIVYQPQSFQEVSLMVDLGLGITVFPRATEKNSELYFVDVEGADVNMEISIITEKENNNQAIAMFLETISEMEF